MERDSCLHHIISPPNDTSPLCTSLVFAIIEAEEGRATSVVQGARLAAVRDITLCV